MNEIGVEIRARINLTGSDGRINRRPVSLVSGGGGVSSGSGDGELRAYAFRSASETGHRLMRSRWRSRSA
jgi:hypothetical protein